MCLECLEPHRPSCPQWLYLETQASWYSWELSRSPWAFELPNVGNKDLHRVITYDWLNFSDRFGAVPSCVCGRYRDLYPDDSKRRFQKGLRCGLCGANGQVRTFTAREIRVQLAPRLFEAGAMIASLDGTDLSLDAHARCITKLGERVSQPLFLQTITAAASA